MLTLFCFAVTLSPVQTASYFSYQRDPRNCKEWAEVANFYIGLGEEEASRRLQLRGGLRAGLLCRILYESKTKDPIRPPAFGGLPLPYYSMPAEKWPNFPLAEQNGVWFLLSDSYALAGKAESLGSYLDHCKKTGRFRTAPVKVPMAAAAGSALNDLVKSERWKAMRWTDSRSASSYSLDGSSIIEGMRKQASF